jgi:site-specific recombinase XerD
MYAVSTLSSAMQESLRPEIEQAKTYIRARHSDATRRCYAADLQAFNRWCESRGLPALPAHSDTVVLFLAAQAAKGQKPATIVRKLAAIRHLHREAGHPTPTDSDAVRATLAGIKRDTGTAQRQAAPATADRLMLMLAACGDDLVGKRDRALLAIGFGGALRRSELVGLRVEDIEQADEGLRIHMARSKTDQEGHGQVVPVLDGVRLKVKAALADWMEAAGITAGPIFRSVAKGGKLGDGQLTDRSVSAIVKKLAKRAGLDPALFSGHSLRAGFLTSAAASGASLFKMMDVSRHKKVDTVQGYVRMAEQFKDHAGAAFM